MKNSPAKKPAAPKKPAAAPAPGVGDEVENDEGKSAAQLRDEEDLNRIRDTIARLRGEGGATITLERKATGETDFAWLTDIDISDYDLSSIQRAFGGGYYKAIARTSAGTIATSWRFKIDTRIPPLNPNAPPPAPAPADNSAIKEMAKIIEPLTARLSDRPKENTEFQQLFMVMLKGQQDMMTAILGRKNEESPAVMALLSEMKEMRREINEVKASRGAGGSEKQIETVFALMDRMEERAERHAGGGGDDKEKPSFGEAVGRGLAAVAAKYLEGGNQFPLGMPGAQPPPRPQPKPVQPVNPGATPAAPAGNGAAGSPGPVVDAEVSPPMNSYTQQFATRALTAAANDEEPYDFVRSLFSFVPAPFHQRVYEMANVPTWRDDVFSGEFKAAADTHADWLDEMRDAVLEKMFVQHCIGAHGQKWDAEKTVASFVAAVVPEFHPVLMEMKDPDEIKEVFTTPRGKYVLPEPFVEEIRVAIEKNIVPATASSSATSGAAAEKTK